MRAGFGLAGVALAVLENAPHGQQGEPHQGDDPERDAEVVGQQVADRAGDVGVLDLLQPVVQANGGAQQGDQGIAQ
ncbi:hypothetical protein D9M71_496100 [compost metagenome]